MMWVKKVRDKYIFIAALCIIAFSLAACSDWKGDLGSISIGDPGDNGDDDDGGVTHFSDDFSDDIIAEYFRNDFTYMITYSNDQGDSGTITSGAGKVLIPAGTWKIKVEAVGERIRVSWESDDDDPVVVLANGKISRQIKITPTATRVSDWKDIKKDLAKLDELGISCIEIVDDFDADSTVGSIEINRSVTLKAEKNVKITRKFSQRNASTLFTIKDATLTLGGEDSKKITIDGNKTMYPNNTNALINVLAGGNLIMHDGVTLTNNRTSGQGGGVYVQDGGTFNMIGGVISANTAGVKGGGVYVVSGGKFTKKGGSIKSNIAGLANSTGNGHAVYAGGDAQGNPGSNDQIEDDNIANPWSYP